MADQHFQDIARAALESARYERNKTKTRGAVTLAMSNMSDDQLDALASATLAIVRSPAPHPIWSAKRARAQLRLMSRISIAANALVACEDERVRGKVHDAAQLDALGAARDVCAHSLANYARALTDT